MTLHIKKSAHFLLLYASLFVMGACGIQTKKEDKLTDKDILVEKRGLVVYPSDLTSLGADWWINAMRNSNLNLLGIHTDSKFETLPKLKVFLESTEGQKLTKLCKENSIDIEFELHVLQDILPRKLFDTHPEYFRMDKKGVRQQKHNMCFTSEGAYREIEKSILNIAKWLKPTTHRYFYWTDDYTDVFCHCEKCKEYSASEQALIYENRLLKILKTVDPKATVAHLAYHNTLAAPEKIKPLNGIFLEYAPIGRNYNEALSATHLQSLQDNLKVFPKETAHILEYWLDVSFFSGWKKDNLVAIPWNRENFDRDVIQYAGMGAKSITSFGAWINNDYVSKFGDEHAQKVIIEYGEVLSSKKK